MMSLLPLNTLSEAGCLFIEARLLGNPGQIISQIGLTVDAPNSSIAVFSRTSGVLLVAGVGSFFAYRVASNFLGNRFVWECLEASRFDQIPTGDRRLLYSFKEEEEEEDEEEEEERLKCIKYENGKDSKSIRSVSQISLSRLNQVRRSVRNSRGLLGSLSDKSRNAGIVNRQSSKSLKSAASNVSIPNSCSSSIKSASFRLFWEGSQPAWDDSDLVPQSSNNQSNVICRFGNPPSTSSFLFKKGDDLQSVGDLCSVFNDVLSVSSVLENNDPLLDEEYQDEEEEKDDKNGIWKKCMTDNRKYMYQSFVVGASESGSEIGSPQKQQLEVEENSASFRVDSEENDFLMTKSQNSKKSNGKSMYDSAIGGEISSDDGSIFMDANNRLYVLQEGGDTLSVIAPSCASLEWCDDISRENNKIGLTSFDEEESQFQFKKFNLDWDMNSDCVKSLSISSNLYPNVNSFYAPKMSRDLMVIACEMFQPYSPAFKEIQTFYHKKRLKRVGNPLESLIQSFIRSTLYHKCSLLRNISWINLEKRFDATISECDFMRKWPDYHQKSMRNDLKSLHQLASNNENLEISESHKKSFEILLAIEAKRAYDEKLAGLFCEDWFDIDSPVDIMKMIHHDNLPQKILWNLICRISGINIELIDARSLSQKPKINRYLSSSSISTPTLTWIQVGAMPTPLFFIPDDE